MNYWLERARVIRVLKVFGGVQLGVAGNELRLALLQADSHWANMGCHLAGVVLTLFTLHSTSKRVTLSGAAELDFASQYHRVSSASVASGIVTGFSLYYADALTIAILLLLSMWLVSVASLTHLELASRKSAEPVSN